MMDAEVSRNIKFKQLAENPIVVDDNEETRVEKGRKTGKSSLLLHVIDVCLKIFVGVGWFLAITDLDLYGFRQLPKERQLDPFIAVAAYSLFLVGPLIIMKDFLFTVYFCPWFMIPLHKMSMRGYKDSVSLLVEIIASAALISVLPVALYLRKKGIPERTAETDKQTADKQPHFIRIARESVPWASVYYPPIIAITIAAFAAVQIGVIEREAMLFGLAFTSWVSFLVFAPAFYIPYERLRRLAVFACLPITVATLLVLMAYDFVSKETIVTRLQKDSCALWAFMFLVFGLSATVEMLGELMAKIAEWVKKICSKYRYDSKQ